MKNLSEKIGLKSFYVKDESFRSGLNAFKVLGGSYAIGSCMTEILDMEMKDIVFVTATDGNHGKGVAWTANCLKQKSKVFMPKGSSKERLNNIRAENSDADIYDCNYDDCVRMADKYAKNNGGVLIQDTSWEGYEKIPKLIMQGYMTMAYEVFNEMKSINELPIHIFIQAGVGALAAAVTGFFVSVMKDNIPAIIIVEPNKANCIYRTADVNDGKLHTVKEDMDSIMVRLCCGELITIGWTILKNMQNILYV